MRLTKPHRRTSPPPDRSLGKGGETPGRSASEVLELWLTSVDFAAAAYTIRLKISWWCELYPHHYPDCLGVFFGWIFSPRSDNLDEVYESQANKKLWWKGRISIQILSRGGQKLAKFWMPAKNNEQVTSNLESVELPNYEKRYKFAMQKSRRKSTSMCNFGVSNIRGTYVQKDLEKNNVL